MPMQQNPNQTEHRFVELQVIFTEEALVKALSALARRKAEQPHITHCYQIYLHVIPDGASYEIEIVGQSIEAFTSKERTA